MEIKIGQRVQFRTGMYLKETQQEIVWVGTVTDCEDTRTDSWFVTFDESTGTKLEPWSHRMHSSELESA